MKHKLLSQSTIIEAAEIRYKQLKEFEEKLRNALEKAPHGKIHIVSSGRRVQYYLRRSPQDKSGQYISMSDSTKLHIFLQKSYNEKTLKSIEEELSILEKFLNVYRDRQQFLKQIYESFPLKSQSYISPIDLTDEKFIKKWLDQPYKGKPLPEDGPVYTSDNGDRVRSKSELNIANALYKNRIPYKYECPLILDKYVVIYPDFTVLNPHTRKIYYWEHRGMMDDRDYARHSVKRIKDYQEAGIFLGDTLIITEETATIPLGTDEINRVIEAFFMNK